MQNDDSAVAFLGGHGEQDYGPQVGEVTSNNVHSDQQSITSGETTKAGEQRPAGDESGVREGAQTGGAAEQESNVDEGVAKEGGDAAYGGERGEVIRYMAAAGQEATSAAVR